jgi:hypothetical protein
VLSLPFHTKITILREIKQREKEIDKNNNKKKTKNGNEKNNKLQQNKNK